MKPDISIVMPTMRIGGLDIIFESLKYQTFKNFEFIISDSIYKYRKDIVAEKTKQYSFAVKHVEPTKNTFPIGHFCNAENTGLVNASSNIVLMITDYTYLQPTCIEQHIAFHNEYTADNRGYMGSHQYKSLPTLHADFIQYTNEDTDKYVSDLAANKFSNVMWSIFDSDFIQDPEALPLDSMGNADTKLFMPYHHNADQNLFNGKNESVKTEAALSINGWDEDLDGTTPYQDNVFSDMLVRKLGLKWSVNGQNKAYIVNPRSVFPWSKRMRPIESNLKIWRTKEAVLYKDQINDRSIRDERTTTLAKEAI